jgi:hypothetical protein
MSRSLKFKVHTSGSAMPEAKVDPSAKSSSSEVGVAQKPASEADALLSFAAEGEDLPHPSDSPEGGSAERPARAKPATSTAAIRYAIAALVLLMLAAGATAAFLRLPPPPAATTQAAAPSTGSVAIDSRPRGADVVIAGVLRGQTPLKLSLPVGQHSMELRSNGATRTLPLDVQAGTVVSQYVEFAVEEAVTTGRLEIASDPAGAQVRIDGTPRGTTPLSIASIAPGDHTVAISSGDTVVTRRVTVAAGATATVVASVAEAGSAAGYVRFNTPFEVQVFEDGELLGTTAVDRLMLPTGRHDLDLVNPTLEFKRPASVQVVAGRTTSVAVPVPNGSVSVNAQPWADVSIDGRSLGTTPMANIAVPIGSHELVFRHPQFGERRRNIIVTASTPLRIGMDLRQ